MSTSRKRYRLISIIFISLLCLFVVINFIIWKLFTEDILSNKKFFDGDLTRIGYIAGSKLYRVTHNDLPVKHIELNQYTGQSVDIVSIGDSFSNGGGGGKNSYYQDYISNISGKPVLNLPRYKSADVLTSLAIIVNNGMLDKIKPKYVVLEKAEMDAADELGVPINFDIRIEPSAYSEAKYFFGERPSVGFINQGNFKFLLFNVLYRFSDNAFGVSEVCVQKLSRPLFSATNSDKLLYNKSNIRKISHATSARMMLLNQNLNTMSQKLSAKGIKLYFMPVVEKYNLYSEFIINNPYPQSTFFEELRKLPKTYYMIDTKALLLPEVRNGVTDVFYPDDGHWSWKASKKIFENIHFP